MLTPQSLTEQLLYSTVRIETKLADGNTGSGTGFFFTFNGLSDDKSIPVIITNKHVIRDSCVGTIVVHNSSGIPMSPSGESFPIIMPEFESRWIHHPDPDIDLCALIIVDLINQLYGDKKQIFRVDFNDGHIPSNLDLEKCTALEDVVMVGYPNGLWDDINNFPLLRRGATASHPSIDFQGKPTTVVDMACFPGSSGSPIVIANEYGHQSSKEGSLSIGGQRAWLLGVLFAGPIRRAEGNIELRPIPTSSRPVAVTDQMIHLGYIVKAREILALGNHIKKSIAQL
jgi:hypothetical protein